MCGRMGVRSDGQFMPMGAVNDQMVEQHLGVEHIDFLGKTITANVTLILDPKFRFGEKHTRRNE